MCERRTDRYEEPGRTGSRGPTERPNFDSPYPWVRAPEADPIESYDPDQGREIGLWERGWPL